LKIVLPRQLRAHVTRTIARSRALFESTACLLLWLEQHGPRSVALVPAGYTIPDGRCIITLPPPNAHSGTGYMSPFRSPALGPDL
jgi:hypothetical protein